MLERHLQELLNAAPSSREAASVKAASVGVRQLRKVHCDYRREKAEHESQGPQQSRRW